MKRVVSVSLGTSKRDKVHVAEILGQEFTIERRGTDGDRTKFKAMMEELDGKVDALGVGGADIYLKAGGKTYAFREILGLISGVKHTPVVDGSGLKHTLERETILRLQADGIIDFKHETVLLVSAVDRHGMAQALSEVCDHVIFGDFLFGLGLPIPIRGMKAMERLAKIMLPVVTLCPIQWFYPTGKKQEERTPKYPKVFAEASVICGDWHYIRRYAPNDLAGKTIITQTLRTADLEWLKSAGLKQAITTTPIMGGETFATNVMEGVIVTLLNKKPADISVEEYQAVLKQLDWKPNVIPLNP